MNVTKHQLNQLLNGIIPLSLNFLREDCSASEITVIPKPGDPLYLEADDGSSAPLTLNFDPIVGFTTLVNKSWDYQKIKNYLQIIANFEPGPYSLIDVGANVGLFSRQLKSALGKKLEHIRCYEPHPGNYRLLEQNLSSIQNCEVQNVALGRVTSKMNLNLDRHNSGNYSLNETAVPKDVFAGSIQVDVIDAAAEAERLLAGISAPLLYKSDTQGFDQTIAASLPPEFWRQVKVATFELWRLPDKDFDEDAFLEILKNFQFLRFETSFHEPVDLDQVRQFMRGSDMKFDDLYAWNESKNV